MCRLGLWFIKRWMWWQFFKFWAWWLIFVSQRGPWYWSVVSCRNSHERRLLESFFILFKRLFKGLLVILGKLLKKSIYLKSWLLTVRFNFCVYTVRFKLRLPLSQRRYWAHQIVFRAAWLIIVRKVFFLGVKIILDLFGRNSVSERALSSWLIFEVIKQGLVGSNLSM